MKNQKAVQKCDWWTWLSPEDEDHMGNAHFMEHMAFKGTDPKSNVSIRFHRDYKYDRTENQLIRSLFDVMKKNYKEGIREEVAAKSQKVY